MNTDQAADHFHVHKRIQGRASPFSLPFDSWTDAANTAAIVPKREAQFLRTVQSRTDRGISPANPCDASVAQIAERKSLRVPPPLVPHPTLSFDPLAWRPRMHHGPTLLTVTGSVDPQQAVSAWSVDALQRSANSCSAALQRVVTVDYLTVAVRHKIPEVGIKYLNQEAPALLI